MKSLGIVLIAVGLVAIAATAVAQGQTSFTLVGKADQKWYLEGQSAANPTIEIAASSPITITIKQEGDIPHNIQVAPNPASDITNADGETLDYTFTSPATGTLKYICVLHGNPMSGTLRVFGSAEEKESPGVAALGGILALAGAALLVARRAK